MRKLFVSLVAALALAVTIVVLATPGTTAAGTGTFIQAGYAQWYPSYANCTNCYVRIVNNHTGAVTLVKVGDTFDPAHWTAVLQYGTEYHLYLQYEGHFCAAYSLPNPDIVPADPFIYEGFAPGRNLLLEGQPGVVAPCPS